MIKDLYPIHKQPFEELLLKNNYILNEETYKKYIHPMYCFHITKTNEPCRRKKIQNEDFCINHIKKTIELINKCGYIKKNGKQCARTVINDNICHCHISDFTNKTYNIYNHLYNYDYNFNKIYICKLYNLNKSIRIIEYNDYVYSNNRVENKIIKYNIISVNDFINEIFLKYENYLLKNYKINVFTLLKILYIIYLFDKNYKILSFSSKLNIVDYIKHIINNSVNVEGLYNIVNIKKETPKNKIDYNIKNNYYYISKNIFDIKIKDIDIKRRTNPRLICYQYKNDNKIINHKKEINKIKLKRKKEEKKYKTSLDRLYNLNTNANKWITDNVKSFHYKYKAINLIRCCMDEFERNIIYEPENKMEHLRIAYKNIYIELTENFEHDTPNTKQEKKDYDLLLKQKWEDYNIYQ